MATKIKAPKYKKLVDTSTKNDSWDNRPSISFDETQLKEAVKLDVGDNAELCIKVTMTSKRIMDYPAEKKGMHEFSFKIIGVAVDKDKEE